jgi:hypothetical protein
MLREGQQGMKGGRERGVAGQGGGGDRRRPVCVVVLGLR